MITHIVAFRWKPETTADQLAAITAALDTMPANVLSIRSYRHGADLGTAPGVNFDYAIVATFDDLDGWRQYDTHPVHDAARANVIRPWIADRAAIQFETA
jgi:Stress responsive A/B Barrel Domain